MFSRHHILALGFLPGITTSAVRAVVESGASFEEIMRAPAEDLAALGMRRAAIDGIGGMEELLDRADMQITLAREHGASIIQYWDDDYPPLLRPIYSAPVTLYVHGKILPEDQRAVAIVGTRGASIYGRLAAERYAGELAAAGITVISGLARGIDTYAHVAALKGEGRTIAVVASGLDQIQPSYAAQLAGKIVERGAVVSEYPFGVKALRPYFPQRNRIISGMSAATLVVESDESGGAMITAGFAFDQDRELFAVPGPISSPKSRGPNLLIRTDRARLTQNPADLLEMLGYKAPSVSSTPSKAPPPDLTLFEHQVYEAVGGDPVHIDIICENTGLPSSEALVSLLALEFKGLVRQMAGKIFVRG